MSVQKRMGLQECVYDPEILLECMGGNREMVRQILRLVICEIPGWLAQSRQAVDSGEPERIFLIGHTIGGSLSTIGAKEAAEVARRLEAQGRSGDLREIEHVQEELERTMTELISVLRQELD